MVREAQAISRKGLLLYEAERQSYVARSGAVQYGGYYSKGEVCGMEVDGPAMSL
jgi:hypothetical protein